MDVKDPILHGVWCNNLDSFVAASDKNTLIIDLEGRSPPLVKFAAYFDAEGVGELLVDGLIKFDRIERSLVFGFLCREDGVLFQVLEFREVHVVVVFVFYLDRVQREDWDVVAVTVNDSFRGGIQS